MAELKDSGNRREFESGAVRDMQEGKGRMDLIPWGVALKIREEMYDLFYTIHPGYEVEDGKYKVVPAWGALDPITEYANSMDRALNDYVRSDVQSMMTPKNTLRTIEDLFVKMAATFIMYQQLVGDPAWGLNECGFDGFPINDEYMIEKLLNCEWSNAMLQVAKHYEDGAHKYAENNWRKGMKPNIYFDSAMRHFVKWLYGMTDEPHDRAFVWNCMCGAWEARQEYVELVREDAKVSCNPQEGAGCSCDPQPTAWRAEDLYNAYGNHPV